MSIFQLQFLDKGEEYHVKHHSSSHIDFNSADPQNQQSQETEETGQEVTDNRKGFGENDLSLDVTDQHQVENEEDGFLEVDSTDSFIIPDNKVEQKTSKEIAYTEGCCVF